MVEDYLEINWTDWSIDHIARHNVEPNEIEQGLFDDDPIVLEQRKDRRIILCSTWSSRLLFVVISFPPDGNQIKIITARDVNHWEKKILKKRRKGRKKK
jgi:hypothetical protein